MSERDVLGNRHRASVEQMAEWLLYDRFHITMNEWDRARLERDIAKWLDAEREAGRAEAMKNDR